MSDEERRAKIAKFTLNLRALEACGCAGCQGDPALVRTIARVRARLQDLGALVALLVALLAGGCRTQLELDQVDQLEQRADLVAQVDAGELAGSPDLLDPLCSPVVTALCPHPPTDGGAP